MKTVLITNGSGGCGKDTMAEIMGKYVDIKKVSSIDVFKEMVKDYIGEHINFYGKDEKYRKLLSIIKSAFVEFNDLPFHIMLNEIVEFFHTDDDILLMDIREAEEIKKIVKAVEETIEEIQIKTVLVINDNVPIIESVKSDQEVFEYAPYDYVVDNSETLATLEQSVITLLIDLGFEVKLYE